MNKPSINGVTSKRHEKQSISLRDIARELDISHATVSLALRSNPRISAVTQIRVKEKADEMGYHPDPMLSALSHYRKTCKERPRQAILAWIHSTTSYRQEEFNLYWEGAKAAALELGFRLEEFQLEGSSLKQLDAILKYRNIHGLVVAPVDNCLTSEQWSEFPWKDYSAIRFGRSLETPSIHFVTSAQISNTMLAFRTAVEKGYERIGFIGEGGRRRLFLSGYLGSQYELPEDQRLVPLVIEGDNGGLQPDALANWMKKNKPDAILTDVGELPSMLDELGVFIPQDVGVATLSIHDTPIDSGIDQNPREIGATVVRTLISLLNEHHFGIPAVRNSILVDGCWVDGPMLPDRS